MSGYYESKVPESDWKKFRALKDPLLNRLAERINARIESIIADSTPSPYEKYLRVFEEVKKSDDIIARCFDDWRRSRFMDLVLSCYREGLFTESELSEFSEDTKQLILNLKDL